MNKDSAVIKIIFIFQALRAALHFMLLRTSPTKTVIEKDIERWLQETQDVEQTYLPNWGKLVWLLWHYPEFRNLFYYRLSRNRRVTARILVEVAKFFYKPMETLFISTPVIGEGLFIQHGFSTIIAAQSIGKNCWVNQQVTIGFSSVNDSPTIGDNVKITAGAKVIGNITIGDNSIVGANAVVIKNVPPNCTVVGVPAYIAKRDGKKVREPL